MNTIKIDNVEIFGEALCAVTDQDLGMLKLSPNLIIHLLRHYKNVSETYKSKLRANGISYETIEAALETIGSKFELNLENEVIADPTLLFQRVIKEGKNQAIHDQIPWIKRGNRKYTSYSFFTNQSIGYESLVRFEELSSDQKDRLIQQSRGNVTGDEFTVWTLNGISITATNKITVELFTDLATTQLLHISIYPGSLAPDFPSDDQLDEEQKYNASFWQTVAFVQG